MHTNLLSPALQQSFCWFVCPYLPRERLQKRRSYGESRWRLPVSFRHLTDPHPLSWWPAVLVQLPRKDRKAHIRQHARAKSYTLRMPGAVFLRAGSKDDQQHPNFSCSMYDLLPRTSCVASIASKPPRHQFPCDARSSSRKRSSNVSSSLSASCASVPMASSTTRSPQFKLAVSTSSKLAAEKFSSPLQIVILLLYLITYRTNSAAGRACSPSLLTISTSLRMREKGAAWTCFLPAAMKPTIKQSAKPFKTTLRLSA